MKNKLQSIFRTGHEELTIENEDADMEDDDAVNDSSVIDEPMYDFQLNVKHENDVRASIEKINVFRLLPEKERDLQEALFDFSISLRLYLNTLPSGGTSSFDFIPDYKTIPVYSSFLLQYLLEINSTDILVVSGAMYLHSRNVSRIPSHCYSGLDICFDLGIPYNRWSRKILDSMIISTLLEGQYGYLQFLIKYGIAISRSRSKLRVLDILCDFIDCRNKWLKEKRKQQNPDEEGNVLGPLKNHSNHTDPPNLDWIAPTDPPNSNSSTDILDLTDFYLNPVDFIFEQSLGSSLDDQVPRRVVLTAYILEIITQCQTRKLYGYPDVFVQQCRRRMDCVNLLIETTTEPYITFEDIRNVFVSFFKEDPNDENLLDDVWRCFKSFVPEAQTKYNPRSLTHLCRCVIRDNLGRSATPGEEIFKLPIRSGGIRDFILFHNKDIGRSIEMDCEMREEIRKADKMNAMYGIHWKPNDILAFFTL